MPAARRARTNRTKAPARTTYCLQQAQQDALRLLALTLDASTSKPSPANSDVANNDGAGQGGAKPDSQALPQLRLIKSLQEEVNTRTRQLQPPGSTIDDDTRRRLVALGHPKAGWPTPPRKWPHQFNRRLGKQKSSVAPKPVPPPQPKTNDSSDPTPVGGRGRHPQDDQPLSLIVADAPRRAANRPGRLRPANPRDPARDRRRPRPPDRPGEPAPTRNAGPEAIFDRHAPSSAPSRLVTALCRPGHRQLVGRGWWRPEAPRSASDPRHPTPVLGRTPSASRANPGSVMLRTGLGGFLFRFPLPCPGSPPGGGCPASASAAAAATPPSLEWTGMLAPRRSFASSWVTRKRPPPTTIYYQLVMGWGC